jgi:hypothetical protein
VHEKVEVEVQVKKFCCFRFLAVLAIFEIAWGGCWLLVPT